MWFQASKAGLVLFLNDFLWACALSISVLFCQYLSVDKRISLAKNTCLSMIKWKLSLERKSRG